MKEKVTTFATVHLTVSIPCFDTWKLDCTLEQVYRNAKEKALQIVSEKLRSTVFHVVDEVKVSVIITEFSDGCTGGLIQSVSVPEGKEIEKEE